MNVSIPSIVNEEIGLPCVVYGTGVQKKQCHIIRNEGYNLHQIIFSIKGNGILKVNGEIKNIPEGSYFYLKPNEAHEYYKNSDTWETHWIMFSGENIENLLKKLSFNESTVYYNKNNIKVMKIYNDISNTLKSCEKFSGFIASTYLYNLLVEIYISRQTENAINNSCDRDIISPIIDYINLNFTNDIELETLAKLVDVTPQYLCKVFKKKLLIRPFEYITRCRIQEAKKLLLSSNMTIKNIASSVGFRDTSYFCATFKKYETISPSQFRGII